VKQDSENPEGEKSLEEPYLMALRRKIWKKPGSGCWKGKTPKEGGDLTEGRTPYLTQGQGLLRTDPKGRRSVRAEEMQDRSESHEYSKERSSGGRGGSSEDKKGIPGYYSPSREGEQGDPWGGGRGIKS